MSICGLGQSESVISLSRSATRCLLARLLSDDHCRHHPVLYRCAPRIPIDILLHLLTWVYSYRFQVTSVYVQCIGPDAYRETSPTMGSNNPPVGRPGLPMSYSQSSIGSTNGLTFSQSQMGSFNASQSVASTPRATPPPKVSQQSSMSFNYSNGLPSASRSSFGGFDEPNGYGQIMPFNDEFKPQIYRVCESPTCAFIVTLLIRLVLLVGSLLQRSCLRNGSQWSRSNETP